MSQLLNPNDKDLVLDVCAAPGGKSSHISELMSGKGKIISIDKYITKVDMMKRILKGFKHDKCFSLSREYS